MHIFSGIYKGRKIATPKGLSTRPTSGRLREALFNICQGDMEGADFLDLFAGSGAMGLEALSRGAKTATFVDNSKESIRCIQANISSFRAEKNSQVIYGDVFTVLKGLAKQKRSFDIIYADPPYDTFVTESKDHANTQSFSAKVIALLDDLIDKQLPLLRPGGFIFIEDSIKVISNEQKLHRHLVLHDTRTMGRSALQQWKA